MKLHGLKENNDGFSHSDYRSTKDSGKIWCGCDKIERFILWLNDPIELNKVNITDAENPLPENSFNNPEYYDANEDNSKYDLTLVNA